MLHVFDKKPLLFVSFPSNEVPKRVWKWQCQCQPKREQLRSPGLIKSASADRPSFLKRNLEKPRPGLWTLRPKSVPPTFPGSQCTVITLAPLSVAHASASLLTDTYSRRETYTGDSGLLEKTLSLNKSFYAGSVRRSSRK